MPAPTSEETLLETLHELRAAAQDAVLDAARVWRLGSGAGWSVQVLLSAIDALASAEGMLGQTYDNAPLPVEEGSPTAPRATRASLRPSALQNARPAGRQGRSRARS